MGVKGLVLRFAATVGLTLGTSALVGYLWSLVRHGSGAVDWETSARLGITLGIVLACGEALERLPRRRRRP